MTTGIDLIKDRTLDFLHAHSAPKEVQDIMTCQFNKFECGMNSFDIALLINSIAVIHHYLFQHFNSELADSTCDLLLELIPVTIRRDLPLLVNKNMFFIWIGSIGRRGLQTIDIWRRSNRTYAVSIWSDRNFLLASDYSILLRDYDNLGFSDPSDIVAFQNSAYSYIFPLVTEGISFDIAVIDFLYNHGLHQIASSFQTKLRQATERYTYISKHFSIVSISENLANIMDAEFRDVYLREIILRGNLAAASDILRLHVLYSYGGLYIDCDTLPGLQHIFTDTDEFCSKHKIRNSFIDVLKAEFYRSAIVDFLVPLSCFDHKEEYSETYKITMKRIEGHLCSLYPDVVILLYKDIARIKKSTAFFPLGDLTIFPDGLLISTDPHNKNCFNNNVIVANSKARFIRIVIREMRTRYRYIEGSGIVYSVQKSINPLGNTHYDRLLGYRYDGFSNNDSVTVILSGPGLIFEVMIGVAYSLIDPDADIDPVSLSYVLYSDKIGVSFRHQIFHTYDHSKSSWMKPTDFGRIEV